MKKRLRLRRIIMEIVCGDTVIVDGVRHRVTAVGVRGCGKDHPNSPVEYHIEIDGRELEIAVLKQRGRKRSRYMTIPKDDEYPA